MTILDKLPASSERKGILDYITECKVETPDFWEAITENTPWATVRDTKTRGAKG